VPTGGAMKLLGEDDHHDDEFFFGGADHLRHAGAARGNGCGAAN